MASTDLRRPILAFALISPSCAEPDEGMSNGRFDDYCFDREGADEVYNIADQGELDDFVEDFADSDGCFPGKIEITNQVEDLSGLVFLTQVGTLDLRFTYQLEDLDGLENLVQVGTLQIFNNQELTDMTAFSGLIDLGHLVFDGNPLLDDLTGFESIEELESLKLETNDGPVNLVGLDNVTRIEGDVIILGNTALESLHGLESLQSIGGALVIDENTIIDSISELGSLTTVGGDLWIRMNPLLSVCEIDPFLAQLSVGGAKLVGENLDDNPDQCE